MKKGSNRGFIAPLAGVISVGSHLPAHGRQESRLRVSELPPSVVRTTPAAGDLGVDPSLREIRVTYSKQMMTERMWAIIQTSGSHFPKVGGGIHFLDDKRTCVIPVTLESGKTYVMWFNKGRFNSFRDTGNTPAIPYLLVFRTKR